MTNLESYSESTGRSPENWLRRLGGIFSEGAVLVVDDDEGSTPTIPRSVIDEHDQAWTADMAAFSAGLRDVIVNDPNCVETFLDKAFSPVDEA